MVLPATYTVRKLWRTLSSTSKAVHRPRLLTPAVRNQLIIDAAIFVLAESFYGAGNARRSTAWQAFDRLFNQRWVSLKQHTLLLSVWSSASAGDAIIDVFRTIEGISIERWMSMERSNPTFGAKCAAIRPMQLAALE